MNHEFDGAPDEGQLDAAQAAAIEALDEKDHAAIDSTLLARCDSRWRKVSFVVGAAMSDLDGEYDRVPDVYFASRVRRLVEAGRLVAVGNLDHMRFSEVRLAGAARLQQPEIR